jgi:ankyrin repeat protein
MIRVARHTKGVNMKKDQINNLPDNLIRAIYRNDSDEIKRWQNLENINHTDKDGRTAIFHAILIASKDMIVQLLKDKPNLNIKDKKGWYPLHYAAQAYLIEILNLLIDNGAEVEVKDDYGNTPLWRATFSSLGKGEMIKLLLSKGANPENENDSGISPKQLANTITNYDLAKYY